MEILETQWHTQKIWWQFNTKRTKKLPHPEIKKNKYITEKEKSRIKTRLWQQHLESLNEIHASLDGQGDAVCAILLNTPSVSPQLT